MFGYDKMIPSYEHGRGDSGGGSETGQTVGL